MQTTLMERNKFIFYRDWWEALCQMPPEMSRAILEATMNYALYGAEPDDPKIAYSIFSLIKSQIDRDSAKYELIKEKRREAGRKGGAPKGNQNAAKQPNQANQANDCFDEQNNQKQAKQAKQPINIDRDIDTDIDIDNSVKTENNNIKNIKGENSKTTSPHFIPPTVDQVKNYLTDKQWTDVDPEKFVAYYESNGWMVGRNKMKSWTAACRTWHYNTNPQYPNSYGTNQNPGGNSYADARQKGDEEFAKYISSNLRGAGLQ